MITTTHNELVELVKQGRFFSFCVSFALNLGYEDVLNEKKDVKFSVGDYDIEFSRKDLCFTLSNRVYFARIIQAYLASDGEGTVFIGNDEQEVIDELLAELEKDKQ
jgi:hypothetical protein